mmetsp:Transcript_63216/g.175935  ORF Transcript_63216/g.175935 Transcript_63216/m.175935 type:complete len:234 (-) Transcript_63216:20-721(-)
MAALFSWSGINCRPCSAADPTADVVKVDMGTSAPGKENAGLANDFSPAEAAERERRRREVDEAEEARRQASLQEAVAREEAERLAREQAERQRFLAEQERQRLAEERARREALRKRQEEEEKAEAERRRVAEEEAERQRQETVQRDAATLEAFLKENNYRGVNEKRKTALKAKYPLHTAVKQKNDDVVRILLEAGADPRLADSNKLTPQQLANKLNSDGSFTAIHDRLLQASA